jgi:hypothetical protein
MICSRVDEVIGSSNEFCNKMGFKVFTDKEVALSGKGCFDGTPSTLKSGSLRRPKKVYEDNASILETIDYYLDKAIRKIKFSPYFRRI